MAANSSAERLILNESRVPENSQSSVSSIHSPPEPQPALPPLPPPPPPPPSPTYASVSVTRPRLSIITRLSHFRPRSQTLEPSRLPSFDAILLGSNIRVLGRAASPLSMAGAYPASITPPDISPTTPTDSLINNERTRSTSLRDTRTQWASQSMQRSLTSSTSPR
jgi:hypothetical protein